VENNGTGIPAAEKEKIFERGYGKGTGWGLFLAREILAVTGMTIAETGVPGKGVRFEVTLPPGSFRMGGGDSPLK
jgi:signal transduction histidine kinase